MALSDANREIRRAMLNAKVRRDRQSRRARPIAYLDQLVGELEELNLVGVRQLPTEIYPELKSLAEVLPGNIKPPISNPPRVREAIELCFELEDTLLKSRKSKERRE